MADAFLQYIEVTVEEHLHCKRALLIVKMNLGEDLLYRPNNSHIMGSLAVANLKFCNLFFAVPLNQRLAEWISYKAY